MLQNTFLHIPYVGVETEKRLWQSNIRTWDDYFEKKPRVSNSGLIERYLELSKENLDKGNFEFFAKRLLHRFHWRAYNEFSDKCCFLDIETTGLSRHQDDITTIGIFDGKQSKVFINGINLEDFREEIDKYSYIVTFNGYTFDMPFIKTKFPDINFNQFHSDLRYVLRDLGHSGGLKKIERELGIERDSDLKDLTGFDAVRLWHKYKRHNDSKALDLLVRYNIEDIENLKILMEMAYSRLRQRSFQ